MHIEARFTDAEGKAAAGVVDIIILRTLMLLRSIITVQGIDIVVVMGMFPRSDPGSRGGREWEVLCTSPVPCWFETPNQIL